MTKDKDQAIQQRYDMSHLRDQKIATVKELQRLTKLLSLPAAWGLHEQVCKLIELLEET